MHGFAHVSGMTHDRDRQAPAEIRVHVALASIQEALRLLEQATQALCRVDRMIPSARRVGSLSNQLNQTWFAVSAAANRLRRRGHLRLD